MNETKLTDDWLAIVNPNAGNGKGRKDQSRIAGLLEKNGIGFRMVVTAGKGHAIELTREYIGKGYRNFISIGGDGTLNEIVNGIFSQEICSPASCTIGKIPVGTGNDWGRMFSIPLVYEGAVGVIKERRTLKHDIGVIDYRNGDADERRYFINIAGLGFESVVVAKTNRQKEKGKSSRAIYFYNLLSSLIAYRNTEAEITIDGKTIKQKVFSINVGNGRYCGGGMRQTPEALPDDGMFDITVIKEIGRIEIIKSLRLLYDGTVLSHPRIDGYRSTGLTVSSGSILQLEADGESLGHTPATFSIIPSAVNIVYSRKVTQ